jgi:hypothetical protein
MDVKDLEIADARAIARNRVEKDKKIQFSLKFIVPSAVFLLMLFAGLCISVIQSTDKESIKTTYTDKNGEEINFTRQGDVYLLDNEVVAIATKEISNNNAYLPGLLGFTGISGCLCVLVFYYIWTKPRLVRKLVQHWKDTGAFERSEELK